MQYDRKITISAGNNRRAMNWTAQTMLISELWARLQTPARGTETLAEYLSMKKAQQDDLKDVGGFMAGTLSGPRRKANAVTGRDVITWTTSPPGARRTCSAGWRPWVAAIASIPPVNTARRPPGSGCSCPLTVPCQRTSMSPWPGRWPNT